MRQRVVLGICVLAAVVGGWLFLGMQDGEVRVGLGSDSSSKGAGLIEKDVDAVEASEVAEERGVGHRSLC
jgi:hypothetical protein